MKICHELNTLNNSCYHFNKSLKKIIKEVRKYIFSQVGETDEGCVMVWVSVNELCEWASWVQKKTLHTCTIILFESYCFI